MPSAELPLAFLLATLIFAVIPGPGILYTAAQTLARGRVGGLMAALGLHLRCYVHVAAAALCLSAGSQLAPALSTAVKLGWRLSLSSACLSAARGQCTAHSLSPI